MAKPLQSEEHVQAENKQFSHFGVLNTGSQGKGSLVTSITINVILAIIAIIIGAAAKVTIDKTQKVTELVAPPLPKPPVELPRPPKFIRQPPPPVIKPVEPKITLPEVKIEAPKPVPVPKVERPQPAVAPAPPKPVVAAAAPKPTTVNLGRSAAVVNNSPHPAPVALGQANNPIAPSNRPATASVDLGQRGLAGMPAGNTGTGPASTKVQLGSGQPGGSVAGGGARAIQGVKLGGVTGGTGTAPGNGVGTRPATVQLGQAAAAPQVRSVTASAPASTAPKVLYKPKPAYTPEATAMHLEGVVSVRIHVSAAGAIQILGVTSGLGHGLDQSAERAVTGMRFQPATDASGHPVDWEGIVNITFQMAN
ncbi:TonB family protein [Granulicella sp. WH15]|uniref:energy transducer TonB n=1 Tax=Granulicella sp. WH15 TaxID=2602070 RepID=UPI00136754F9|nr:energy transducer TonB [Granulicella sp. WH15]QHN02338.1 TonB family protein [Granulicella sp. WH15]